MWRSAADSVLPARSWLRNESSKTNEPTPSARSELPSEDTSNSRSRSKQALVSIWRTVGSALTHSIGRADINYKANNNDLESPLTEADLREYENAPDSPRVATPSTSTPRTRSPRETGTTPRLPELSPRQRSPRNYRTDWNTISTRERIDNSLSPRLGHDSYNTRTTYTPSSREWRRERTPSPPRPNYTESSCRAVDQNYVNSMIRQARGLCDTLLDTEEAEEYVELHASVLKAREDTLITLRLARAGLHQNWGAVFYVPSQLKVIGWSSEQYLVIDKLTRCSTDGGPSPAMIAGVKVGDVVVGVNGQKITSNTQFVNAIKKERMITLDVVRPDEVEEICDEEFEDAQEDLIKEVVAQAEKNALASLARMKRMDSRQKRVFLDECV